VLIVAESVNYVVTIHSSECIRCRMKKDLHRTDFLYSFLLRLFSVFSACKVSGDSRSISTSTLYTPTRKAPRTWKPRFGNAILWGAVPDQSIVFNFAHNLGGKVI
jgi:hypothetical protein